MVGDDGPMSEAMMRRGGGVTDMQVDAEPFRIKPELQGEVVLLRPFTETDIASMGPVLADPVVLRLTGSVHTTAASNASTELDESTLAWYRGLAARPERLDLAIIDLASGCCVGEAVLNNLDAGNDSCNFRILIGSEGRDRGLGTEAAQLITDHAFRTTGLWRISLEVYSFNPRARRVYERAGFQAEGVLRGALRFDDARVDAVVMSLLRTDWEAKLRGA
ncbi:RimJ/RimL family protein N-acetyltransferase [Nakamurella sp. UYEF19]|uniref:GNAT family N-acetyltransferase n=1 Tax=Nakamurella sp. UYEF19 TaxID=1756392 RepID=UPI0033932E47